MKMRASASLGVTLSATPLNSMLRRMDSTAPAVHVVRNDLPDASHFTCISYGS